jgi:hypothetical protein
VSCASELDLRVGHRLAAIFPATILFPATVPAALSRVAEVALVDPRDPWFTRVNQRPPDESPSRAAGGQFKQMGRHRARPVPYVLRREPSPRSVSISPVTKTLSVSIHLGEAHGFAFRRTGVSVGHGLKGRRPQPETTRGPRRLPAWQNLKLMAILVMSRPMSSDSSSHIEEVWEDSPK